MHLRTKMNIKEMIEDIESLPPEKQEEVADFVAFLKSYRINQHTTEAFNNTREPKGFFGMWADRTDMKDSISWVRNLRKNEWG